MPLSKGTIGGLAAGALFTTALGVLLFQLLLTRQAPTPRAIIPPPPPPDVSRRKETEAPEHFIYAFNSNGTLQESEEQDTASPYWWLNSGGKLVIRNGIGSTIQGDLPPLDPWRIAYNLHNPV